RRIWPHAYFETRVEEQCALAAKSRSTFALARLKFSGAAPWTRVTPLFAQELVATNVFASYGPQDYEILFIDTAPGEAEALVDKLLRSMRLVGLDAQAAVAWYPKDGRTSDALLASANSLLKAAAGHPSSGVSIGSNASVM